MGECTNLIHLSKTDTRHWESIMSLDHKESFIVDRENPVYRGINGSVYSKDMTQLFYVPKTIMGIYVIPETVQIIGKSAFRSCQIQNIIFSKRIKSIASFAFQDSAIETIDLFNTSNLGDFLFWGCEKLLRIRFPQIEDIYGNLFFRCHKLQCIEIWENTKLETIPEGVQIKTYKGE